MKTYKVTWENTLQYETEVEASSEQAAINKAKELCHGDEYEVEHHGNHNYSAEEVDNND